MGDKLDAKVKICLSYNLMRFHTRTSMLNLLMASYKPPFISSNAHLLSLKKHFKCKKGGYLGTLDPFAKGVLVVGFGKATRLFPHLQKAPKVYRATLWLGVQSRSLDIEHIDSVKILKEYAIDEVERVLLSLRGVLTYNPPIFSAKHVDGRRAYALAREGRDFTLPSTQMNIYDIKLLSYCHPFIHFEVSVSEGGYVRSIGEIIANRLGAIGVLSSLERISEGIISVGVKESLKILNPLDYLPYKKLSNTLLCRDDVYNGRKIVLKNIQKDKYIVCFEDFFSIIKILNGGEVEYILNRMEYVDSFT